MHRPNVRRVIVVLSSVPINWSLVSLVNGIKLSNTEFKISNPEDRIRLDAPSVAPTSIWTWVRQVHVSV
jgi:hypothetical protein